MTEHFILIDTDHGQLVHSDISETMDFLNSCYQWIRCDTIQTIRLMDVCTDLGVSQKLLGVVDDNGLISGLQKYNLIASMITGEYIMGPLIIGMHGERQGEPDIVGWNTERDIPLSRIIYKIQDIIIERAIGSTISIDELDKMLQLLRRYWSDIS